MSVYRTVELLGGPKDGQEVRVRTDANKLQFPIPGNCGCCFAYVSYKRHRGNLFVYDDGKERVKKVGCTIKPCLTRTESEELVIRELTDFLEREGCEHYYILQEDFRMTEQGFRGEQGFQGEIEIYIHSGGILENEA